MGEDRALDGWEVVYGFQAEDGWMATRQTKRQLHFSGLEMTLLGVSFVFTTTAVFFLGLFVGKKNASYHAPVEDRVARVPVDDFTKYKRPEPVVPKTTAAPSESGAPVAASGQASIPAKAESSVLAKPAVAAPAKASEASPVSDKSAADAAASKAKEAAAKVAAEKEAAEKEALKKKEDTATTGRGYTVQLLATRKEHDAEALVRKLKSRGYAAYVKKIADGGGAWYRVRVGSYGAFSEARAMADRCHKELNLGQAFVSTE